MDNSERKFILYTTIVILTISNIALIIFSVVLIRDNRSANNSELPLTDRVGNLIIVNKEETPTVATVEDVNTLKAVKPDIYKDTENGDKVLVYSDKVIIYREEEDLIINVIPLNRFQD